MTNDKDGAALLREAISRLSNFCDEWAKMRQRDDDIHGLHFGEERQAVLRASDIRTVVAALKSHGQPFDAALLDRAELAWQRFFYPAADNFDGPTGDKLTSVDLEVADCLRLALATMGRHVVTPRLDVPAIQPALDAAGVMEACADEAHRIGVRNAEDDVHPACSRRVGLTIQKAIRALPIPEAPASVVDREITTKPVAVGETAAGVTQGAASVEPVADDVLMCDVKLPPATTVRAGCSFDTLRLAISAPGRPRHFDEPDTIGSHFGNGGGLDPDAATGCADDRLPGSAEQWRAAVAPPSPGFGGGDLRRVVDQCMKQFAFYATEHAKAGKVEKAATNQRFADLCHAALSHDQRGGSGE